MTLSLWVVFDRPRDFPGHIVVREQRAGDGRIAMAFVACLYDTIPEAMHEYEARGLTWIPRDPADDPVIVGVWL